MIKMQKGETRLFVFNVNLQKGKTGLFVFKYNFILAKRMLFEAVSGEIEKYYAQ